MADIDNKVQEEIFDRLERLAKLDAKKYVRLKDAKEMFSMGNHKTREIGEAAKAIRKIDGLVLYNVQVMYDYIENMYSKFTREADSRKTVERRSYYKSQSTRR